MRVRWAVVTTLGTALMMGGLSGCGGNVFRTVGPGEPTMPAKTGVAFSGMVLGAGRPVAGASVQLYAAGAVGPRAGATALLAGSAITDATGHFQVSAGSYTCTSATAQLYLVARGGQAVPASGAVPSGSNASLAEIAVLGTCGGVTSGAAYALSEATTVAAAWGLAQFVATDGTIGASATNGTGLANAVLTAQAMANVGTGGTPGVGYAATTTAPTRMVNLVANLLAVCAANGGSAGCSAVLAGATPARGAAPGDTLAAAVSLAQAQGTGVHALYALAAGAPAVFVPSTGTEPADWTMVATHTGGGLAAPVNGGADGPTAVAVDANGQVWVASHPGVVTALSPVGAPVFANGLTVGGLHEVYGLAVDGSGNVWATNTSSLGGVNGGQGSVTELSGTGAPLSGTYGYGAGGLNKPFGIAIDPNGSVWVTNNGNARLTVLNSGGVPLSGATGYSSALLAFPQAVAIDANHNAWVGNATGSGLTRVSPEATSVVGVSCCNGIGGLAVDAMGFVWATNFYGGTVSRVAAATASVAAGGPYGGGGLAGPIGVAIDGAGAAWVANFGGGGVTELAGSGAAAPGAALSPAAGWADGSVAEPFGAAIDASGNVWLSNFAGGSVTELIGAAAPVKTPLLGPVQQP